jgi:signal transduction histidine kinase
MRGIFATFVSDFSWLYRALGFALAGCTLWVGAATTSDVARAQQKGRRVLIVHAQNTSIQAGVLAEAGATKRLSERSREPLEFHTEFLDVARFPGNEHETRMARYLADKYRERKPDVVLAMGPQPLRFAIQNRSFLGFDSPTVFCCASPTTLAGLNLPADTTGIVTEFDLTKTLAVAQRLQPTAKNIVVVSGADPFDRRWSNTARRQLAPYEQKYDVKYLDGLAHDDLLNELKSLPRDTIVILLTIFADSTGRQFIFADAARDVAHASAAPVYTPYEGQLGNGIVGGYMDSFEQIGGEMADIAFDILEGADPSTIAPKMTAGASVKVDWRQLKRWNIAERDLPPGSQVHFREPNLWEQYRWYIIAVAGVLLAQAAALAWMYMERRRRQVAQGALRQRLLEVIHLNRSAVAGALSASVAHELNQPLGAIQSYAEAAELYLKADPPNIARVEQILANIRRDDQRAAEIISHFRGLLKRRDVAELQEFDVNDIVRNTLGILDAEAMSRGVAISANHAESALPVRADQVHLQQVILNLAVNGMDAMQNCAAGTGRMSIETALAGESEVEVTVADSGTGIPADKLKKVFDTFYTTKRQGTGLGLSLARTIVETYGGKIWAENRPGGGAAFRFTLPLARSLSG